MNMISPVRPASELPAPLSVAVSEGGDGPRSTPGALSSVGGGAPASSPALKLCEVCGQPYARRPNESAYAYRKERRTCGARACVSTIRRRAAMEYQKKKRLGRTAAFPKPRANAASVMADYRYEDCPKAVADMGSKYMPPRPPAIVSGSSMAWA